MSGDSKPTVHDLGIDVDALTWHRSGGGQTDLEVAFAGDWVLLRVGAAQAGDVLVFDHGEWDAFVRGVKDSEFDDTASPDSR